MSINKNVHDVEVALGFETGEIQEYETEIKPLSTEWFKLKGKELKNIDVEAKKLYDDFEKQYGKNSLYELSGEDLLKTLFLGGNTDNLCHELEYVTKNKELFGSVKGGNSYKYPLFFDKDSNTWKCGTQFNPKYLSLDEAITKGTKVRDELIKGIEIIEQSKPLNCVEDYLNLYTKLYSNIPDLVDSVWVSKYFHMIFPDIFPVFYNNNWQNKVLNTLNINPSDSTYGRFGQIVEYIKKCEISNVVFAQVFYKYCNKIIRNDDDLLYNNESQIEFDFEHPDCTDGQNLIVYGTPGCGKSYYVQHTLLNGYPKENYIRTTFYQDYTNTDFIGQILPIVEDEKVTYKFNPGPFTLALEQAIKNTDENTALVIEELNRGNAASIFGDIFQLLDRNKNGVSEYSIINVNIINYLNEKFADQYTFKEIRLPGNFSIFATMNTSDQNVFTLDTAFKRRWKFEKLLNEFKANHQFQNKFIPGADICWKEFVNKINKYILESSNGINGEDKQLGVYFVDETGMREEKLNKSDPQAIEDFAYKVLEYLWADVAKFDRGNWFVDEIKSLDDLVKEYKDKGNENNRGLEVFVNGIFDK